MKKLSLVLLTAIISFGATAQKTNIKYEEFDLDNGLHVILHQDNSTPIVAVSVLYHVGSKNEDPGRTGFAHFFEHLLFEGSENIGRGEYMELVQSNGGALNANTTQDRTFYYEILPSNQLELGLWMESERMLHAKIDNDGVETQREVVKEEKRMRVDNQPYGSFISTMFKNAFPGYFYEWAVIGSMEDLNAAQLDEFIAFYKKFYVPNNATLSIAGDLDIKETKALIEKYFNDVPRGAEVVQPVGELKPLGGEVRETVYDNIQLPGLFVGYRMPEQDHPDAYALSILSTVLSDGPSSRVTKRMVDEEQVAIQAVSFAYSLEDAGIFINLAIANQGKTTGEIETIFDEEVAKVQTELITEKEMETALNKIENSFVSSVGSMAGIAENLANYYVYYGDAGLINDEIDRYRKVTREDIMRVAKQYLVKENRVILEYLPKSAQEQ